MSGSVRGRAGSPPGPPPWPRRSESSSAASPPQNDGARVSSGILAILFYVLRAGLYVVGGEPQNALWSCHVASLAVGFGLLLRSATLNAIGFLWVTVGVPAWLLDLATGGRFRAASLLTHFGGLVLGFLGVSTLGLPEDSWWKALLALASLHVLTRAVTTPAQNVNLTFAVWRGWESWFPSHGLYLLFLGTGTGAVFLVVTVLLRRTGLSGPARSR